MGSGGLGFDAADVVSAARLNQKTFFVGTGSQINGLGTTYPGQMAYCTSTGNGFTVDHLYQRNAANSAWNDLTVRNTADGTAGLDHMGFLPPYVVPLFYGLTQTGATTISSNTDLGSANAKWYASLTVNDTFSLTGNTNMILVITGTLATNTSGKIHVDNKVAAVTGAGTAATLLFATQTGSNGKAGTSGGAGSGGSGGGFGGVGGNSMTNTGGSSVTVPIVPLPLWGIAGSGGGGNTVDLGGTAGGFMFLYANAITGTGTFSANGGQGTNSGSNPGTGGGSGGMIIYTSSTTISGITVNAQGGAGSTNSTNQRGGGGGGGIIHEYYGTSTASTRSVAGGAVGTGGGSGGTAGSTGVSDSTQI